MTKPIEIEAWAICHPNQGILERRIYQRKHTAQQFAKVLNAEYEPEYKVIKVKIVPMEE